MTRFGRDTAMRTASTAISASVFLLMADAHVALGDDLKGYSIDATYNLQTVPGAVIAGELPRHGIFPVQHHERMYVSVRGNVFDYSDLSSGRFASHGGTETQLDKAKSISRERMQAWTVEPGRLLRVQKGVEGIIVATFTVDPSKSMCTVSYELHPDPKTGRTVMELLDGATAEIRAFNVSSATCTVRKGNIFASDQ
jgi:hypothetical protein